MGMIEFARFLYRRAEGKGNTVFLGAVAAGILQGVILYSLMRGVQGYSNDGRISLSAYAYFLTGIAGYFIVYKKATFTSVEVALSFIAESRTRIADSLRRARYADFVTLDQAEIYSSLSESTDLVTEAARFLPNCIAATVLLFAAMGYSLTVSLTGFCTLALIFVLIVIAFRALEEGAGVYREESMAAHRRFLTSLASLFGGFVEVRMNERRNEALYRERIMPHARKAADAMRRYEGVHMRGNSLYAVLNYIPTGVMAFVLPFYSDMKTDVLLTFIGVAMFSIPALINMAMFGPLTAKAMDTVTRITALEARLAAMREEGDGPAGPAGPGEPAGVSEPAPRPVPAVFDGELRMRNVSYTYPGGRQEPFTLDVADFSLRAGELLFICGGNGSGKSTFFRVLAGLLPPERGSVTVDGRARADLGMDVYRSLFSVVFSDFFLFDALLGIEADAEEAERALALVHLDRKVRIAEDGSFSTTDLSTGQRKRLALACAILEARPVLLLDEVAADFDPQFREYFYRTLLPELRREGRTVVAISHDDRYFGVADRLIKMEYGRMLPREEGDAGKTGGPCETGAGGAL